jgi:hypothetical protein
MAEEQIIDITRPREVIATCPCCGMVRNLPEGWQDMMRATLDPDAARTWDGLLRCLYTLPCQDNDGGSVRGTVMTTRLVVRD